MTPLDWLHARLVPAVALTSLMIYAAGCVAVERILVTTGWWDE